MFNWQRRHKCFGFLCERTLYNYEMGLDWLLCWNELHTVVLFNARYRITLYRFFFFISVLMASSTKNYWEPNFQVFLLFLAPWDYCVRSKQDKRSIEKPCFPTTLIWIHTLAACGCSRQVNIHCGHHNEPPTLLPCILTKQCPFVLLRHISRHRETGRIEGG